VSGLHTLDTTDSDAPPADYRRWVPNALTASRIVIATGFFVLLSIWNYPAAQLVISPRHPVWAYLIAAGLFGLAAVTDAIDGPLARRWKTVSKFGRVMDPFADKVLVMGAFIMLAGPTFGADIPDRPNLQVSGVTSWMVVLMLSRELLVTSIRSVMEQDGVDFSARVSGKAKMIVQAGAIPLILLLLGVTPVAPGAWGRLVIDLTVYVTLAITVISGIPYVTAALKAARAATHSA